jgi:hypothetical protein
LILHSVQLGPKNHPIQLMEAELRAHQPGEAVLTKWEYFEAKHICLLFYLLCFSGLYIPSIARSSTWGLWVISACHFLEFLVKINVLRQAVEDEKTSDRDKTMHRGLFDHFILTMVSTPPALLDHAAICTP